MGVEHGSRAPVQAGSGLRVGVRVNSLLQPNWCRKIISDLRANDDAQLALLILTRSPDEPGGERRFGWHSLVADLYRAADDHLFRHPGDALNLVDISDLVRDLPTIERESGGAGRSGPLEEPEIEAIARDKLDVLIWLGDGPERGAERLADLARYGVWVHRLGNSAAAPGTCTGIREVLEGHPVSCASLKILGPGSDGGDQFLCEARRKTDRRSVRRQGHHLAWTSTPFVARALRRLRDDEGLVPIVENARPSERGTGHQEGPANGEMVGLLARFAARIAALGFHQLFYQDQWVLAFDRPGRWDGPRPDLSNLQMLEPPRDRFWADPFPIDVDRKTFVFVEEYPFRTRKGVIAVITIDAQGRFSESRTVLERDYHLSYPLVFRYEGSYYMIPETTMNRTVELYRCVEFPHRWEFDRVLLDQVRAADATLVEHDGLWWLFASVAVDGALNDCEELGLYHAESPLGPWRPHRRNPVKIDIRSARPAGRLYRRDGSWFRPAQNCMDGYGRSMVINQIVRWDRFEYAEVEVARILPDWNPRIDRTHTLNATDRVLIVDARVARPRFLRRGTRGNIDRPPTVISKPVAVKGGSDPAGSCRPRSR